MLMNTSSIYGYLITYSKEDSGGLLLFTRLLLDVIITHFGVPKHQNTFGGTSKNDIEVELSMIGKVW